MSDQPENARDYRDTVFLPKTDFPMKAGLPQKEPGILARWQADDIYARTREARAGREQFILHDGPPYANGDMHIGHALNHVLKDMVVRTQTMLGKDAPYVPGWDCHGLPIEWKVEEQYRKKKLDKDQVPRAEFRAECRAYAQNWVDVQREQLKRLGINGNWDQPYLTMQFDSEATIVSELLKFAESGQLYRGAKPVMWSPVEKTALAEAEVEYEDITSTQIDVAFEIIESPVEALKGAHAVIWTTTPWTIPVNQALAYGPEVEYVALASSVSVAGENLEGVDPLEGFHHASITCLQGKTIVIAAELIEQFKQRFISTTRASLAELKRCGNPTLKEVWRGKGSDLVGTMARHPMHHLGGFFAEPRQFLPGDFVSAESGTGLVHMAPDHGEDDFDLCKVWAEKLGTPKLPLKPVFVVGPDGVYRDDWPWLGAHDERRRSVINKALNDPEGPICSDLRAAGALLSAKNDQSTLHSYPHSWRSKQKVIYRCTPQWFVPMDRAHGGSTLRETAMAAIAATRFVPEKGRNRIGSMVEGRPDWVLSRQRAWGVPITLFVHRDSGDYLVDPAVNARIIAAVREVGVDAWDEARAQEYLGDAYRAEDYEQIVDILDVWFDSGSTHAFVLESGRWPELLRPDGWEGPRADLYLEGSDQHRGWFQSSLLEACGTRGHAPYKAVLTHGFTMDSKGMKMSKSLGNTISPLDVMKEYGADIIRLWALSVDYTEDHRIGPEILKGVADQYRKLRNTFRYMLGALDGFADAERVEVEQMPELERYMLSLLGQLDATLRRATDDFDFNSYTRALVDFCNEDLSAFFFDIRKDSLYCDAPGDLRRRAYRTVLETVFQALIRYAAPVIVYTAEEVWQSRYPDSDSVHLLEWPEVPAVAADGERWGALRALRDSVSEAIEPLRRDKIVRSSLEAEVIVPASAIPAGLSDADLAELFITGTVTRGDTAEVTVSKSDDAKCGRCWRLLPEVAEDGTLCHRCDDAVAQIDAQLDKVQ
ncbi:MAG: Isoleucine--tRNA ligase [Pseudomonadota bacterium]|jgi:isoleucyl-tRNA synthetase